MVVLLLLLPLVLVRALKKRGEENRRKVLRERELVIVSSISVYVRSH